MIQTAERCKDVKLDVQKWFSDNNIEMTDADKITTIVQKNDLDDEDVENEKIDHKESASILNRSLQYLEQEDVKKEDITIVKQWRHKTMRIIDYGRYIRPEPTIHPGTKRRSAPNKIAKLQCVCNTRIRPAYHPRAHRV